LEDLPQALSEPLDLSSEACILILVEEGSLQSAPVEGASHVAQPLVEEKRLTGFARMDREVVRRIAKLGGIAAHAAGTAHEFTPAQAKTAGSKGGKAVHANRRARLLNGGPR
jgi:general stress protein YciG